jgi:uncharacterized protein
MNIVRTPVIVKRLGPVVCVLALVSWAGMAGAAATLDEQLMEAARSRNLALIKTLLDKGADANTKDSCGWTPLLVLWPGSERVEIAKVLLQHGADPNTKDALGVSVLARVVRGSWRRGRAEIVKTLLDMGADPNSQDADGATVLMLAARGLFEDDEAVMKLLLARGALVGAKDKYGWTALTRAAWAGKPELVALLKPGIKDMTLTDAACLGDLGRVQRLIKEGEDVNSKGPFGRTPLMSAARGGHTAAVRELLDNGADSGAKDESGMTARYMAGDKGHKEVEELLIAESVSGKEDMAKITISDLRGVWVPETSLAILRETLSPSAAGGAEVVISNPCHDGKQYKLSQTNLREGMWYDLLGLSPTKEPDVYKLRLRIDHGPDERAAPGYTRIKLKTRARGVVVNIIFLDNIVDSVYLNRTFVRVPVSWAHYVNRLIFSGIWEDQSGRFFSFCGGGEGHASGDRSFFYKVPLSELRSEERDPVWVTPFNPFQPGWDGYYTFERTKDILYLYDFPHPPKFQMKQPVILKKK